MNPLSYTLFIVIVTAGVNFFTAAWLYPDIVTMIFRALNKVDPAPAWYIVGLMGFIPMLGRWWTTVIIFLIVKAMT